MDELIFINDERYILRYIVYAIFYRKEKFSTAFQDHFNIMLYTVLLTETDGFKLRGKNHLLHTILLMKKKRQQLLLKRKFHYVTFLQVDCFQESFKY